jgi:hypothetical protein
MARDAETLLASPKVRAISITGIDPTVALWLRSVNRRHGSRRAVVGPHITRIPGCPC